MSADFNTLFTPPNLTPPNPVVQPDPVFPTDAGPADPRNPLHAVYTGGDEPPSRPRATARELPEVGGRSPYRKYASMLFAAAAVITLGALVFHKLRQPEQSGLKDPVAATPVPAPRVNVEPRVSQEAAPVAEPVTSPATPAVAASAQGLSAAEAASAPAATTQPAVKAATVTPALAEAQAAQLGINANLTAGLEQVRQDLAELKAKVDGMAAERTARTAAPVRTARAHPKPVAAPAPAPVPTGNVLAVDLWDGQPSVVVGTGIPADKRVLFLREGDSKNGVTVKAANPAAQSALFDVNGREALLRADGRSD